MQCCIFSNSDVFFCYNLDRYSLNRIYAIQGDQKFASRRALVFLISVVKNALIRAYEPSKTFRIFMMFDRKLLIIPRLYISA